MSQKITFIGPGQVTAVFVGLLVVRNRKINAEISELRKNQASEGEIRKLEDKLVEISILGKEGSESLKAIAEKGIVLNCKKNGNPEQIKVRSDEIFCSESAEEILKEKGKQDHIFVATKTYSHDLKLLDDISELRRVALKRSESTTTVVFAHNGIPFWFPESVNFRQNLSSINNCGDFLGQLKDVVVGCVLNFASTVDSSDDKDERGFYKQNYGVYDLATPLEKINTPISYPSGRTDKNIFGLKTMLREAGLEVAAKNMDIRKELLLKLQVNLAVNGICTITGMTIGEVMEDRNLKKVAFAVAQEASNFSNSLINQTLREESDLLERLKPSSAHFPSMERDFDFNKELETSIYKTKLEMAKVLNFRPMNITEKISNVLEEMVEQRGIGIPVNEIRETKIKWLLDEIIELSNQDYRPPSPLNKGIIVNEFKKIDEEIIVLSPVSNSSESSDDNKIQTLSKDDLKKYDLSFEVLKSNRGYAVVRPKTIVDSGLVTKSIKNFFSSDLDFGKELNAKEIRVHAGYITFAKKEHFESFKKWCEENDLKLSENSDYREIKNEKRKFDDKEVPNAEMRPNNDKIIKLSNEGQNENFK